MYDQQQAAGGDDAGPGGPTGAGATSGGPTSAGADDVDHAEIVDDELPEGRSA